MYMKNIIKLLLVFDIILSALPVIAQKTKATKQPNIVFIISDDHRWDALGAAEIQKLKLLFLINLPVKVFTFGRQPFTLHSVHQADLRY